ncbi:MAG: GAF domain-containing protein [Chloroflexi bacterium]|nr:GAF domain-containing protein [Chloroflexota bacterium]
MSISPPPADGLPATNHDFASTLVLGSRMITAARDHADMALGVLYSLAQTMTAVGITLLNVDERQQAQSRQVMALVSVDGLCAVDSAPRADLLPTPEQIEALRRGLPIVPDLAQAGDITRRELAPLNVAWMASFALRTADEVLGTLDVYSAQPRVLTTEEIDAYTVLADQISVAVRSRNLIAQTQAALDETRTLYDINRAILSAQDTLDVLRALRQHIAPEAMMISHLSVIYDSGSRIQDVVIDFASLPTDDQAVEISLVSLLGADQLAQIDRAWNGQTDTVRFVENLVESDDPLRGVSQQWGARSYIAMTLRQSGLVREAISLGFAAPQVFDERQRRLYAALSDQISIVLQNHRLLRETQVSAGELSQQVRLLQILNQLVMTISSAHDEPMLLDTSCRALIEATGLDHCAIAMIAPTATTAQVISEYPLEGTIGVQIPLVDNPMYDTIHQTRQPLVVHDLEMDTHLPTASRQMLQQMGVRAMLVIPLLVSDQLIGSIGLDVYKPDKAITAAMVETAQAIAAQVGLGLQNLRLLADSQRRAEQLQRITTFSQSAQATLDLPTVFNNMLVESAQMLAQDQMSISLYDASRDALRTVAEHSGGQTSVTMTGGDLTPLSGHIAAVWHSRQLLHIPDVYAQRDRSEADNNIRSWLLAPIVIHGRVLGLVSVGSARPYAYTDTDVALFQQMVTQLAVAIENTEAYSQSQKMVKNESLLNAISTQIQSQMDIEQMMEVTAHELGRALGARRARIRFGTPGSGS